MLVYHMPFFNRPSFFLYVFCIAVIGAVSGVFSLVLGLINLLFPSSVTIPRHCICRKRRLRIALERDPSGNSSKGNKDLKVIELGGVNPIGSSLK
jgi:hypothetical protein